MKFDVVIGNPPYKIYRQFITKSKELSSCVALIVPSTNFKDISNFSGISHYTFKGCYFKNIQLLVSWFIYKENYNGEINVLSSDKFYQVNNLLIAPTDDIFRFELTNKILKLNHSGIQINSGRLHRSKSIIDNDGIKCILSAGRHNQSFDEVTISPSQLNLVSGINKHKVVFSSLYTIKAIGPIKYAGKEYSCACGCRYISVNSIEEADNLISYLNSKLIKFIIPVLKGTSVTNSKDVFSKIPFVNIDHKWTDAELYDYFNLTEEEIDYIEETIK